MKRNGSSKIILIVIGIGVLAFALSKNKHRAHKVIKLPVAAEQAVEPNQPIAADAPAKIQSPPATTEKRPEQMKVPKGVKYHGQINVPTPTHACVKEFEIYCRYNSQGLANEQQKKCIDDLATKFSKECREFIVSNRKKREEFNKACTQDMNILCPNLKDLLQLQCLTLNRARLSDPCKKAFPVK